MRSSRSVLAMLALCSAASAQFFPLRVLDEPLPPAAGKVEAAADFDNDGIVDLLTAGGILLGDGHANFVPATGTPLAASRLCARVADLNGDGLIDVVSTNTALTTPRIEFNTGGLSFTAAANAVPAITTAGGAALTPFRFTKGDVDGDGDVDLVVEMWAPIAIPGAFSPATTVMFLNDGSGTFSVAPAAAFPIGSIAATSEDLADFDADGDLDLILAGTSPATATETLWLMTNGGAGFFALAVPIATSQTPIGPAVGDFNGDGIRDLAVTVSAAGGSPAFAKIFFGSSAGLAPAVTSPMPFWAWLGMAAVDLDQDGRDELLVSPLEPGITVFPVSVAGVVGDASQVVPLVMLGFSGPGPDAIADYDGDGDREVPAYNIASGRSVLLMNDGAGSLVDASGRLKGYSFWRPPIAGDFDADGDLDLVGWKASSLATMLNDGSGFFANGPASAIAAAGNPQNALILHAFDRDGDGDDDLYAARNLLSASNPGGHDLVLDAAAGSFSIAFTLADNGPVVAVRDLDVDGDGDRDIVLGKRAPPGAGNGTASPMSLLVNDGPAGFAPAVPIGRNHATFDLEIADFDGNGTDDVFQINNVSAGTLGLFDPCVLYLNDGFGTFTAHDQAMTGFYSAAGDLDGDGLPDVVLDGQVWFNSKGTLFLAGPTITPPIGAPVTLVDVDEDGDLDIVESPAVVRDNLGGGVFAPPVSQVPYWPINPASYFVFPSIVADFDQDGGPDVLGSDARMHMNCSRQIALGKRARPGRPASLDLYGPPGGAFALFVSAGTAALPVPPYGTVLIDPATALVLHTGAFAPAGAATPGFASLQATLPPQPSLVGLTLYWQMVDSSARLSNRITTTIAGY